MLRRLVLRRVVRRDAETRASLIGAAIFLFVAVGAPDTAATLDDFEEISPWRALPSAGVKLTLSSTEGLHGRALRFDFDFGGHAGWAAARRDVAIDLPENYEFSFAIRGAAAANDLEVKLIDSSGENVWWSVRRDFAPPGGWTTLRLKKRHFSFAWGPARGGEIRHVAALEITVTAKAGGSGWIAIDDLAFAPLAPPGSPRHEPALAASSSGLGHEPARAMDGDLSSAWESAGPGPAWLSIDFGERREYGGLTIQWEPSRFAKRYLVETSDDGRRWTSARAVESGNGGRADLYLPESESRFVRLRLLQPGTGDLYGIREIVLQPLSFGESPNAFFEAIAREAPRGTFPRALSGEQSYWTVVGVSGDRDSALISEDGAVEPSRGSFSLEPFLFANRRLFSWSDVQSAHALQGGDLPIPRVAWTGAPLSLEVTALARGAPGDGILEVRYRVANPAGTRRQGRLFLAIRPFQVNPPQQFLNGAGGAAPIRSLAWDGRAVAVDGVARIFAGRSPSGFGAVAFETGRVPDVLEAGRLPDAAAVRDAFGYASGALAYDVDLAPGAAEDVIVALPIHPGSSAVPDTPEGFSRRLTEETATWRGRLDRVAMSGPPAVQALFAAVRTNLSDILVARDGPALRPGTRSYARSWIRDGAMMSAALLRLGHEDAVRKYIEWFVRYQDPDGRVPCCVDRRGADPVVENDSHGELLYLITEHWRFTHDRAFLLSVFPHVESAVAWIDGQRGLRHTDEFRRPDKLAYFGLLPESISHEGYSAKPVHSYWDDFWALKGLKDATELAAVAGRQDLRARWSALAEEFASDLYASIRRVMAAHNLDTLPASADLADFDPTSTTIALDPAGETARLPEPALSRTFERYLQDFRKRRASGTWEDYTPYELRNVGALVRLGWRGEAQELLGFFLESRRPPEWNAWAEVVGRDPRKPRFIGDLPHAWVGSDFIRAVLDLFAWERASDGAVVLAAGVPSEWLEEARGISVRNLRTPHGLLTFALRREKGALRIHISGGLSVPPGGLALRPPVAARGYRATVNGRAADLAGDELVVRVVPADVVFTPRPRAGNGMGEERRSRSARPVRGASRSE